MLVSLLSEGVDVAIKPVRLLESDDDECLMLDWSLQVSLMDMIHVYESSGRLFGERF